MYVWITWRLPAATGPETRPERSGSVMRRVGGTKETATPSSWSNRRPAWCRPTRAIVNGPHRSSVVVDADSARGRTRLATGGHRPDMTTASERRDCSRRWRSDEGARWSDVPGPGRGMGLPGVDRMKRASGLGCGFARTRPRVATSGPGYRGSDGREHRSSRIRV